MHGMVQSFNIKQSFDYSTTLLYLILNAFSIDRKQAWIFVLKYRIDGFRFVNVMVIDLERLLILQQTQYIQDEEIVIFRKV